MHTIQISLPVPTLLVRGSQTVFSLVQAAGHFAHRTLVTVVTWQSRVKEREQLASLDDRALADIGLTRSDVVRECTKPFWLG